MTFFKLIQSVHEPTSFRVKYSASKIEATCLYDPTAGVGISIHKHATMLKNVISSTHKELKIAVVIFGFKNCNVAHEDAFIASLTRLELKTGYHPWTTPFPRIYRLQHQTLACLQTMGFYTEKSTQRQILWFICLRLYFPVINFSVNLGRLPGFNQY